MVGLTAQQPALYKPKSKIRLRLGLTPPHPKPAPRVEPTLTTTRSIPDLQTSTISTQSSSRLAHSVSTVSLTSRADSRSAFTYDTSLSTAEQSPPFDVISYSTQSPASIAFSHHLNASTYTLADDSKRPAYPTPPADGEDEEETARYAEDQWGAALGYDAVSALDGHPYVYAETRSRDDVFFLTDDQLSERFDFVEEIGFGNWGSVWKAKPRRQRDSAVARQDLGVKLGRVSAAGYGGGARGKVAIKLVHRSRDPTTAARVRALWGEMKILRSLRHEPHPSIIQFEAFVITASYALVIMPYLSHLIPVCLPPTTAIPYFRQLASAVGYLHERGITHNDIKPANVLLGYNDVPVLVDFGFAQKWDVGGRGSFLSSISWGTPEYLDPQRAKGMPHDERASDVWALGITMFEILIGRTPFEINDEEEFFTPEQILIYWERTCRGVWLGEWSMSSDLEAMLRSMIHPDPSRRLTAMQAYHHRALQPGSPSIIITPHFVRAAAQMEDEEPLPPPPALIPALASQVRHEKAKVVAEAKKKRTDKRKTKEAQPRAATPTALGESIKQHTSIGKPRPRHSAEARPAGGKENATPSPQKNRLVIKKTREEMENDARLKGMRDDPTPTKMTKPAQPLQPLRVKELTANTAEKRVPPRTSQSEVSALARPSSSVSQRTVKEPQPHALHESMASSTTSKEAVNRHSTLSLASSTGAKTQDEAVLKTMKSLEGTRIKKVKSHRDIKIGRAAPEPPKMDIRPRSMDSIPEEGKKGSKEERLSLPIDMVLASKSATHMPIRVMEVPATVTTSPSRSPRKPVPSMGSPARNAPHAQSPKKHMMNSPRPADAVALQRQSGILFPKTDESSPLAELRAKILSEDFEKAVRFRQVSGDLLPAKAETPQAIPAVEHAAAPQGPAASSSEHQLSRTKSVEALALDNRLDKITAFVKNVEMIVEEARRAIAEGRELPLPLLNLPPELSARMSPAQLAEEFANSVDASTVAAATATASTEVPRVVTHNKATVSFGQDRQFGVTPAKGAIPAHLRTSSTQVEPATPPKYMTYAEAEAKVKAANEWMEKQGKPIKRERPPVSHVKKIFGDKDKPSSRSNTPEPALTVPLKPPALRGAPSTPALRSLNSFGGAHTTRQPMQRRSESNLRNFNTLPASALSVLAAGPDALDDEYYDEEPMDHPTRKRGVYEQLLDSTPGVVRNGDGWSSWRSMAKPSSMASLRERARALLDGEKRESGRNITNLADEVERERVNTGREGKRNSRLVSTFSTSTIGVPTTATSTATATANGRPATPGAGSVLSRAQESSGGKKGGFFKALKRIGRS